MGQGSVMTNREYHDPMSGIGQEAGLSEGDRIEAEVHALRRLHREVTPATSVEQARWQAELAREIRREEAPTQVAWAPAVPVLLAAILYAAPMGLGPMVWAIVLGAGYAVGAGLLFDEAQRIADDAPRVAMDAS